MKNFFFLKNPAVGKQILRIQMLEYGISKIVFTETEAVVQILALSLIGYVSRTYAMYFFINQPIKLILLIKMIGVNLFSNKF